MPQTPSANAFAHRGYVLYWTARLAASFAAQIVVVALSWRVYDITRDPLALGYVGLVQFVPALALVLVTGAVADRFSRRRIAALCFAVEFVCTGVLAWLALTDDRAIWPIYLTLFLLGVGRAFMGPALQAMLPGLVPREALASAVGWASTSWQVANICGPVAGGLLYGLTQYAAYGTALALFGLALVGMLMVPRGVAPRNGREPMLSALSAGFRFVFAQKIVLGAISLDLFAVLLGGAVALLPVYARDILELGPWGLGLLRAAPGIGAMVTVALLQWWPIKSGAGVKMFLAVGVFGLATVVFGVSTSPWLSIVMLALLGAADMVSVYVRETLIQLATPDDVRGRVSAVNMVFVGASNELGEFRAGTMASVIGTVPAVVFGGVGTVVIALLWAWRFPALRRADTLDGS